MVDIDKQEDPEQQCIVIIIFDSATNLDSVKALFTEKEIREIRQSNEKVFEIVFYSRKTAYDFNEKYLKICEENKKPYKTRLCQEHFKCEDHIYSREKYDYLYSLYQKYYHIPNDIPKDFITETLQESFDKFKKEIEHQRVVSIEEFAKILFNKKEIDGHVNFMKKEIAKYEEKFAKEFAEAEYQNELEEKESY